MASSSTESAMARRSLKARQWTAADERRQQLLDRQKEARRDSTQQARAILHTKHADAEQHRDGMQHEQSQPGQREEKKAKGSVEEHEDEQVDVSAAQAATGPQAAEFRRRRAEKRRLEYASQFMTPQWLDSLPADLTDSWYAIPRPEGTRCFLIANHHSSMSRKRNGSLLHSSIATALPGGCHPSLLPNAASSPDDYCIVDCIHNDEQRCYYALDLLCWRGYLLFDATAEFRLYWMHDKLCTLTTPDPAHKSKRTFYPVVPLPVLPCVPASLPSLYPQSPLLSCRQDGLLFVHKQSEYLSGLLPTPLCLLWKDQQCSQWYVATDGSGQRGDRQLLTGWLDGSGLLLTEDGVELACVEVGQLMGVEQPTGGGRLLVRVSVSGVGDDGRLADVRVEGEASRGRLVADSWDKVLYQANARRGGTVSILQIAEAMQQGMDEHTQRLQALGGVDEMKAMRPLDEEDCIRQQSMDADMT